MKSLDSVQSKLSLEVFRHIHKFMKSVDHFRKPKVCVALSGGVDSVTLLYALKWIELNLSGPKLSAHHINHGTRSQNSDEENFCRNLCKVLDIPFHSTKLELSLGQSNFENIARVARYRAFKENLPHDTLMALGQHIDDSFEWSLMQSFRSSNIKSTLGIPVNNGDFIRPFMCLTKAQILKLAKVLELRWLEDESNSDLRFDRNFIRDIVDQKISKRYPKVLKHYVNRSNEMAQSYGLSSFSKVSCDMQSKVLKKTWKGLGVCFISRNYKSSFSGLHNQVHDAICSLSQSSRGSLHKQVSKFIRLGESGKSGPLEFSGGVYGYHSKGCLFLVNRKGLKEFENLDKIILKNVKGRDEASQIPGSDLKSKLFYDSKIFWPFFMFGPAENESSLKSIKKVNPLLPKSSQYCIDNGIWFQGLSKILDISHKKLKFYV